MFANIAGKSTQLKEDLVIIEVSGDVSSFRNSWREEISSLTIFKLIFHFIFSLIYFFFNFFFYFVFINIL